VRRGKQEGRIPVPPVEVLELEAGAEPASLSPETSWLRRLLGRERNHRFILDPRRVPVEILQGREDFALLAFDPDGRPVLNVLAGMSGELRIGVSCMSVAQMLADPALQVPGGARLPLPNGARLRIHCGPALTFVARVGGPPLIQRLRPATGRALLAPA
jgi:hypothetical protein